MMDRERTRQLGALLRRPASIATISVISLALVAGGLLWATGKPSTAVGPGSSHPAATTATGPSSSDPAWATIEPSPIVAPSDGPATASSAILTASASSGGVIPLDAGFRLESVGATPASELAARLTVQPAVAFSIKPEAGDRAALLSPDKPLQPGAVYRFALSGVSGELLDTWAFQAKQPLRVVGTLPADQTADVPTDTGIEITFDQDGVSDAASHISVEPATKGRFEQHGRTAVFVPDRPLAAATLYSVTVSRGVTVRSTGEATETETRFRFETAATSEPASPGTVEFQDQLFESATGERPIIGAWWFAAEQAAPKAVAIEVYRLSDMDAGIAAFRQLRARPDWSRWSTEGVVDTTGLPRVVSVDARLQPYLDAFFVRLPKVLPAGWYLVQLPDKTRPMQAVLQVTDVAGYLATSQTRTLVWANDLRSGRPIVGAVASSDGGAIGTTDANGLAIGDTPATLLPAPGDVCSRPCDPVVAVRTVDGRGIFLPARSSHDKLEGFGDYYYWYDAHPDYWSLLHTDRDLYRPGDTVNAWGVIRDRDTGKVPATVSLRLTAQSYENNLSRPPVSSLAAAPGPSGALTGSLALKGLAEGYYSLDLLVGDVVVRTTTITVGPIVKPAYRLEVTTGRRVYIAGDRIKVSVQASFFEGTPVPGVPLRIDGYVERNITTDAEGTAIYRTTAKPERDQEGANSVTINVNPARAEEGEISGASRDFLIFPSSRTVDASARIAGGRVVVSGAVHLVDVGRLESEIASGRSPWEVDPNGKAVPGATVTVRFMEQVPIRTRTGTTYDFIEKKVVPAYQDEIVERAAGTVHVKTTANGSFKASIPATTKDHDYVVIVTVGDPDGHVARTTTYANRHPWSVYERQGATLQPTDPARDGSEPFAIGDRIDVTMADPATKQTTGDGTRYLFFTAQRGLRETAVQSSSRYITTFTASSVPDLSIGAVRFTGRGYEGTVAFQAVFRSSDRHLQVDLTAGAARYAPGDTATVDVRTRDAAGRPIAATVILRAVDEKLFVMGAASADDPLAELYAPLPSGILDGYRSHRDPGSGMGGGDTTGGGGDGRVDFRDSLLFKSIDTDANGRASVSFALSDDLTSWRVTGSAITAGLDAGVGSVLVAVGLPFFVDASIAPEYLLADRPSIAVRAFGTAVAAGDPVTIQVTSKTLGFDSGPIKAAAFKTTVVPLPSLHLGPQTLTISATTGTGATARTDRLTRSFTVVESRLAIGRTAYVELPHPGGLVGGVDGSTTIAISDAGAGRYLSLLTDLAEGGGVRIDRALAAEIAASLLADRFGSAPMDPAGGTFEAGRYQAQDGGLALLPYSSSDVELSALVALVAPDKVDGSHLESYLQGIRSSVGETRERQMFALAGLAGLGGPVLPAIRDAAADTALTVREQLMIGLGAVALGDRQTARSISSRLTTGYGERLGDQARLRVGVSAADMTQATALMAVLSAALGEDLAPLFWAYVEANPAVDQLQVLPAVAYLTNILQRLPVKPAGFAYTVDGKRTEIALKDGMAFELVVTASQLASLTIEPTSGTIGVTTSWREPVLPADLHPDPDVTISRTFKPATIQSADLVTVDLKVTFGPQAAAGCRQVTELVPSGLTPVGPGAAWIDPNNEDPTPFSAYVLPYDQSGPRVYFCAGPDATHRTVTLRYYARVVTPGTYVWEPAIAGSPSQDGHAALTAAGRVVIR